LGAKTERPKADLKIGRYTNVARIFVGGKTQGLNADDFPRKKRGKRKRDSFRKRREKSWRSSLRTSLTMKCWRVGTEDEVEGGGER
jgi:hypothetical protein